MDSLKVFRMGLVRYLNTVVSPVLISAVAVMPGWIAITSPGADV